MIGNKVSKIEFHITAYEQEDFILRAAELIKEGYSLESIRYDELSVSYYGEQDPPIHIVFTKEKQMIIIIIDDYTGQKYTYTMPDTATVEVIKDYTILTNGEVIKTGLAIGVDCAAGIRTENEDIAND